jgi:uncharacterized protein
LLDWRLKVAAIYEAVRASPDPVAAHRLWQDARNELLTTHPQSPVPPADRPRFAYNPSCAYDPAWACPLAPPGNTVPVPVDAAELMRAG